MQKIRNSFYLLICIFLLNACSLQSKALETKSDDDYDEWVLPVNDYPEIFELYKGSSVPVYRVKIEPKSLKFECSKRNDYPHYWCNIRAVVIHDIDEYPNKILVSFMSSRSKEFVKKYEEYIERIKNNSKRASLNVSYTAFDIDEKKLEPMRQFSGVFVGLETEKFCINWFNYFDNCPNGLENIIL